MRYILHDKQYHFKYAFDTETGAYVRIGVLDADGKDTGVDPFMASYPHLMTWVLWDTVSTEKQGFAQGQALVAIKAAYWWSSLI